MLQTYGAKGVLTTHPLIRLFFCGHFEEAAKLFTQFAIDTLLVEECAESARYGSPHSRDTSQVGVKPNSLTRRAMKSSDRCAMLASQEASWPARLPGRGSAPPCPK